MVHISSCLLVPTDKHLDEYDLMEGAQRGARAGYSGTVDNLLIDRTVALDCHRRRRNLSMAWIDVKKAFDSVDHGWLNGVLMLHRFPVWLCRVICKLCKRWYTKVVVNTRKEWRLFTICLNPVAWKISATEGYRLSKPINVKVSDLLYIDDLKIFAASESKLSRVIKMVKAAMGDVGLEWNPKKCAVVHVRRGMQVSDDAGVETG